jgi:uncharacterized protein YigE (DUF2233 family)
MTAIRRWACSVLLVAVSPAFAVECSQMAGPGGLYTQCAVDLATDQLRLFWKDSQDKPYRSFTALREALARTGKELTFAMNGGMYEPDLSPVGLFVTEQHELHSLNRGAGFGNFYQKPNGVFALTRDGAAVMSSDDYAAADVHPRLATQSGPLLLWHRRIINSALFRPGSRSRHTRNGVCAPSPNRVLFIISQTEVTFFEFAQFFKDKTVCQTALYLDGSISSLYAPSLKRADSRRDLGTIIAVVK